MISGTSWFQRVFKYKIFMKICSNFNCKLWSNGKLKKYWKPWQSIRGFLFCYQWLHSSLIGILVFLKCQQNLQSFQFNKIVLCHRNLTLIFYFYYFIINHVIHIIIIRINYIQTYKWPKILRKGVAQSWNKILIYFYKGASLSNFNRL
jgi:hypothetical protein